MPPTLLPCALRLFNTYSRQDVHSIFSPETKFVPQAGNWGLHGIVSVPNRPLNYVFFVTFGQAAGTHQFDEFITEEGVLAWQSQPRQGFHDRRIQSFIGHREEIHTIHLFLRGAGGEPYFYMGRLKYLWHDPDREFPVHFEWQLLDWPPTDEILGKLAQFLRPAALDNQDQLPPDGLRFESMTLMKTDPPVGRARAHADRRRGTCARPDYLANHKANEELGKLGELLVLEEERKRLIAAGCPDLAAKIRHVAVTENDTAGYDILSYELDGTPRFIEVKTTRGAADADFFISASELAFAAANADRYFVYRLYDYSDELRSAKFYVIRGRLELYEKCVLVPTVFKVRAVQRETKRRSGSEGQQKSVLPIAAQDLA